MVCGDPPLPDGLIVQTAREGQSEIRIAPICQLCLDVWGKVISTVVGPTRTEKPVDEVIKAIRKGRGLPET
jgi:hypothetical protein